MEISLSSHVLRQYVSDQLSNLFPDPYKFEGGDVAQAFSIALERMEYCLSFVSVERYRRNGNAYFNHLCADQYLLFIWFLSNTLWVLSQNAVLCDKLFSLNRALNAFNCTYDTNMPDVFLVFHGCGTVLGKATYSNFFVASQQCTVGIANGVYPVFGQGVRLGAGASVMGHCNIGSGACVNANTHLYKRDVPDRHIAFANASGAVETKAYDMPYSQRVFNVPIDTILPQRCL